MTLLDAISARNTITDFGVICYTDAGLRSIQTFLHQNHVQIFRYGQLKARYTGVDIGVDEERNLWKTIVLDCPGIQELYFYYTKYNELDIEQTIGFLMMTLRQVSEARRNDLKSTLENYRFRMSRHPRIVLLLHEIQRTGH